MKRLVWWVITGALVLWTVLLGGCPKMVSEMINPKEHVKFLGKVFVDRLGETVLRIGNREWNRVELAQRVGVGNFRAAGELTTVCRKAQIRTIQGLYEADPRELAMVKGLGETTIYVAMAVLQAEGYDALGWWKRMDGFAQRQVTFRTLKIREKGRKRR